MNLKRVFWGMVDLAYAGLSFITALLSYLQAKCGPERLPIAYRVWDSFGVAIVRYHYYQPVYDVRALPHDLWSKPDPLFGMNWNEDRQLSLLEEFKYYEELERIPIDSPTEPLGFFHRNNSFGVADAEMLYNMVRHFKPKQVIEIGSGYSTRMMKKALDANKIEGLVSAHVCIEPFEMPWLEKLGVDEVVRSKVEDVDLSRFHELEANDILFIDSSHVLRTAGDVFVEYLHVLPTLKKGVIVHIHDIFIPYEYPKDWIAKKRRFWTEQYILQAFLTFNPEFEILSAVHWLAVEHSERLANACPVYGRLKEGHGSFWIRRI